MEMFDYSRTETIADNIHWMMKFFDKAKISRPVIGDRVTIDYTGWGDYYTHLDINGIQVWIGKLSTPSPGIQKEMTNNEFWIILKKPESECDGYELHLRHLWENNNSKSIFEITGLDFSNLLCKKQAVDYLNDKEKKNER